MVKRVVRYEEIILDSNYKRFVKKFLLFTAQLFRFFLGGASVTRSPLSQVQKTRLAPFPDKIRVAASDTYTVAFQSNNRAHVAEEFHSEASARDYLERQVARDPGLVDVLHVIPSYEKAA
jgi:hypothetical protein